MVILIPNKKTGALRLKKGFLTVEERLWVKADYIQNCCLPRTISETGHDPKNYGERLQVGSSVN